MLFELNTEQLKLANYMSEISERCFSAGWMHRLEFDLWDALINGSIKYGQDFITEDDIAYLKEQSKKCNSWIIFHDDKEETAVVISEWEIIYNTSRNNYFSN